MVVEVRTRVSIREKLVPDVWPLHRSAFADVVAAVDSVHYVPKWLPGVHVRTAGRLDAPGAYIEEDSGKPLGIYIWAGAERPRLTLAHEIGHLIHSGGLCSVDRPLATAPVSRDSTPKGAGAALDAWERLVRGSDAVRRLLALRGDPLVRDTSGRVIDISADVDFDYLLDTRELWARSYAQYIARRSADPTLNAEVEGLVDIQEHATVSITQQWTREDFGVIIEALDHLFEELGWLR